MNTTIKYKGRNISIWLDRYGQTVGSINGIHRVYISNSNLELALAKAKALVDSEEK